MWHVYVIENIGGRIYIGFTVDLAERLQMHNSFLRPGWTRGKGPWKLIHQESFTSQQEARKRETLQ